ncbi:MAG: CYTH domain-containing protein [Candidatus Pacebacteria bacterium]|nr:CYTH domain-containing protein [Candidatus Paceibacterota bacterium]
MQEIETKILEVDVNKFREKMLELNAEKILDTRLSVDWFKAPNHEEGKYPWFLRIRTDSEGNSEITWKGKREHLGASSTKKEINLKITDLKSCEELFLEIGLEIYGHQEKDRISWKYKDWRFDLDQYPKMPAYLEIEGNSEESIQEAIKLFGFESKIATPLGERDVITKNYGLNWFDMHF